MRRSGAFKKSLICLKHIKIFVSAIKYNIHQGYHIRFLTLKGGVALGPPLRPDVKKSNQNPGSKPGQCMLSLMLGIKSK